MNIQSSAPVTPLRQRMTSLRPPKRASRRRVEDMAARNLGRHSRRSHLYSCEGNACLRSLTLTEGSPERRAIATALNRCAIGFWHLSEKR